MILRRRLSTILIVFLFLLTVIFTYIYLSKQYELKYGPWYSSQAKYESYDKASLEVRNNQLNQSILLSGIGLMVSVLLFLSVVIVRIMRFRHQAQGVLDPSINNNGLNIATDLGVVFPKLTVEQEQQLAKITPSQDSNISYYPCQVQLKDGSMLSNVYLVEATSYLQTWGVIPDADKGKQSVRIEDVVAIYESPNRLPAHLANKIYEGGESGMGYCIFKIVYDNHSTLDILTGNAVDFVPSATGLSTKNIKDVLPHQGSREKYARGLIYHWCLYNK